MKKYRHGNLIANPQKIWFLERKIDVGELSEIFRKYPPDEVILGGPYITDAMERCVVLAKKHGIVISTTDPRIKSDIADLLK